MTYDAMIQEIVPKLFPKCPSWLWIKAQMWQESKFDPNAVSHTGAMGLMQLMPATAKELGVTNPFDPYDNISGGVRYMSQLYGKFGEIPTPFERYLFALASYNCGRGYVNEMLRHAREAEGFAGSFADWQRYGAKTGRWQTWAFASQFLRLTGCDYGQTLDYVAKICRKVEEYQA